MRIWKPLVIALPAAALALAVSYGLFRLADPLPPSHFAIAAAAPGSVYEDFARSYARILSRDGVQLEIRNSVGAIENLDLLRDSASGVQAALTTAGAARPGDSQNFYSLGAVSNGAIFIFYRSAEPVSRFVQLRGKRLSIGPHGSALKLLMSEVLRATGAMDASTTLTDLEYAEAVEALIAGKIDVAVLPSQLDSSVLQRALAAPGIQLMNVAQAEAIAKTVPALTRVVLWRGLISLEQDIPPANIDLLAVSNRVLVRKDLHPALQYLLLNAMREVHWAPGPFNRLGEFPAERANDLPLSPTAEAFYRSGTTFWQRYTSYWLTSLLNRFAFFVIPFVVVLVPLVGLMLRMHRWARVRRINRLHRALGNLERALEGNADSSRFEDHQKQAAEIGAAVRLLKVARPFEVDLQRLRIHLRMVEEAIARMEAR